MPYEYLHLFPDGEEAFHISERYCECEPSADTDELKGVIYVNHSQMMS